MPQTQSKSQSATVDWFIANLGKHEVSAILSSATIKRFQAKEVIFRSGEPANRLYLLRKGSVKFYRITHAGHEVILGWLIPGEAFGLGTLLADLTEYIGTAESIENSEAYVWDSATIRRRAASYPRLTENALRIALHYVANFVGRHISLVSSTAGERLARTLTKLGSRTGHLTPAGVEVGVKNEQLASLADINFFTASRLLKKWERQGAVKKTRGKILIRCPEKLLTA